MQHIEFFTEVLELIVKAEEKTVDIFELGIGAHGDMLVDVYVDAGGAEREEAGSAAAEVGEERVGVEGTSDFWELGCLGGLFFHYTCRLI